MSAEFLLGPHLHNNLINLGIEDRVRQAVTDLGHDQRYYVMVRGWLTAQLEGDRSILAAAGEQTPREVMERITFLEKAIRAIDQE